MLFCFLLRLFTIMEAINVANIINDKINNIILAIIVEQPELKSIKQTSAINELKQIIARTGKKPNAKNSLLVFSLGDLIVGLLLI
jgi:hypothetical protein